MRHSADLDNPDPAWWTEKPNVIDTSASAVILYEHAKCLPNLYSGTKYTVERRIKILKSRAVDNWGDLLIWTKEERVTSLNCVVYNMENGRITRSEVDEDHFIKTNVYKDLESAVVPLPNVKAGSVIEYRYTIKSPLLVMYTWDFQHSIPVIWSEYEILTSIADHLAFTGTIGGIYKMKMPAEMKGKMKRYVFTNLPAFVPEPWMPAERFYRTSIRFLRNYSKLYGLNDEYVSDVLMSKGIRRDSIYMDSKTSADAKLKITEAGELIGTLSIRLNGSQAIFARKIIKEIGDDSYLKRTVTDNNWSIQKQELVNLPDTTKDIVLNYDFVNYSGVQHTDSLILINPFLALRSESEPFKLSKRLYPVDLDSRIVWIMSTSIAIPEGYKVESLPKNVSLMLPEKTATFSNNNSTVGNSIYLTSIFKTNKIIFNVDEYPALKEFYDRMVSKRSELIILKKK